MLSSIGRAAIRRSGARAAGAGAGAGPHAGATRTSTTRVVRHNLNLSSTKLLHQFDSQFARSFATATITTKVKTTKSATAKPATKKAPVKKAAKKPLKKKPVAKKPVKKKPIAKKPKAKKVISKEDKKKLDIKALKALILSPPKQKPYTAWLVVASEIPSMGKGQATQRYALASTKYKSLSTAELEAYNHQANENKLHNEKTYSNWLESLTPEQIRISNAARQSLGLKSRKIIEDSRIPKRPMAPYASYVVDKWASGDFKNIPIVDASRQIAAEWKALPEAEKKVYIDRRAEDFRRYNIEYETVYGHDVAANATLLRRAKKEATS